MKTLVTTLGVAAALALSVASTPVFAGAMVDGWAGCNAEYTACLRDGSNMSLATGISEAVSQGSSNTSNWVGCNGALAACYKSLN